MRAETFYIAGAGMITAVGANTAMTLASVRAGMNGYQSWDYTDANDEPVAIASVPDQVFDECQITIETGNEYHPQYDRMLKMAIIAAREALGSLAIDAPVPMILALPECNSQQKPIPSSLLINNLLYQQLPVDDNHIRCVHTGRAGGIQALDLVYRYLYDYGAEYVLMGGSDSYRHLPLIAALDEGERLLTSINRDGFVPGEGAGFLLFTRNPRKVATNYQGIALNLPGEAREPGHLYSEEPYRGEGLHEAVTEALKQHGSPAIHTIYSSMNGEHYWTKELGVVMARHHKAFDESVRIEHPADCYGDLGVATGPVLLALAAGVLAQKARPEACLVYSSSDREWRAAMIMEKLP